MEMTLNDAIAHADLPELVKRYFPESGARPGKPGLCKAVWRNEKHPSFSLYRYRDTWFFRDHATGEKGTAWHFLTGIVRLPEREALEVLGVQRAESGPVKRTVSWQQMVEEAQERLRKAGRVPKELEGRGFTFDDLVALGMGVNKEGAVIPIRNAEGRLVAAKVRRLQNPRYRYLEEGMKAHPWYPPSFSQVRPVLVVEGELNAAIASRVCPELDVIGVAGAENSPQWELLIGRKVFLAADKDPAGERALSRWEAEAERLGILPMIWPPLEQDFCEIAGESRESLSLLVRGLTSPLYTEAVGLREDLEAIRVRLGEVLKERVRPIGEVEGRTVFRFQAWIADAKCLAW